MPDHPDMGRGRDLRAILAGVGHELRAVPCFAEFDDQVIPLAVADPENLKEFVLGDEYPLVGHAGIFQATFRVVLRVTGMMHQGLPAGPAAPHSAPLRLEDPDEIQNHVQGRALSGPGRNHPE